MKRYEKELTLEQLRNLPDIEIDYGDIPELDEAFWQNAVLIIPGEAVDKLKQNDPASDRTNIETI